MGELEVPHVERDHPLTLHALMLRPDEHVRVVLGDGLVGIMREHAAHRAVVCERERAHTQAAERAAARRAEKEAEGASKHAARNMRSRS